MEKIKNLYKNQGITGMCNKLRSYMTTPTGTGRQNFANKLTSKYVYRRYLNAKDVNTVIANNYDSQFKSETIWICWLQGEENAPKLVKKCISTIREKLSDKEIIIIDSDNFKEYVTLPDFIISKWEIGDISNTHFSDLLRLELLIKYGGTWIDSTVFCTGNRFNNIVFESSLFFFSNELRDDDTIIGSSWLITSAPQHPVLLLTRKILYNYWLKENKLKNYFLFHICFTLAINEFGEYKKEIIPVSNVNSHILDLKINDQFNERVYLGICQVSDFHKLSNKHKINLSIENSFYNQIMKGI